MLNNLAHDFSAAAWIFSALYGWLMLRRTGSAGNTEGHRVVLVLNQWVMRLSFIGVMLFGVVRYVFYRDYEWFEPAGSSQVTMLIVKHVIFAVVVVLGVLVYVSVGRFLKQTDTKEE